jgi:hypothetical protein
MTSTYDSRVAALPADLRERLRQRLAGSAAAAPVDAGIPPVGRDAPLPLSSAQQRLWFADQLQPGSPEYHSGLPLRLTGPLDVAALRCALRLLVDRHEILRTRFAERDGQGVQLVEEPSDVDLPVLEATEAELERVLTAQYERPFDLTAAPPLRTVLVRLAPDEHVLLVTAHHILVDGWSMGLLVAELAELYRAAVAGEPPALAPLPVQYADFAAW